MDQEEIKALLSEQTDHDVRIVEELFAGWRKAGLQPSLPVNTARKGQFQHIYWLGGARI
jgi:hypothetical protein